jgi:CubicO group peptidase (beta-lactamase class C family)
MRRASVSPAAQSSLHDRMAVHVSSGALPGLVTLVAAGDEVHVDAIGTLAFDDPEPMARDAIFRIASLTKPIAAATAMALVDDGTLRLEQPIDELVPELAHRQVLRTLDAALDDTVPAHRPITIDDLLSYRMGFGSVMAAPGTYPIQQAEADAGLQSIGGPPWPPGPHDPDQWIAALGALPLMYQPGERWMYNTSGQVLGVLLARAAGTDLESLMRERILAPLGMVDTAFSVPARTHDRLTTFYAPGTDTGAPVVLDARAGSWWGAPPKFPDASGWLVSTVDDYWRFVSMLVGLGQVNGVRVLSDDAVARMTVDHLTAAQRADAAPFLAVDEGWGYGMAAPAAGTTGRPLPSGFGWDGGSGTTWRTHPELGVTGILLTQLAMMSPELPPVFADFWTGVNAAIR